MPPSQLSSSDRLYSSHKGALAKIKCRKPGSDTKGLDCRPPSTMKMFHLKHKLKSKQLLENRNMEIKKDNTLLIQKMAVILTTPSIATSPHQMSKSLNSIGRKRHLQRIDSENAAILGRIHSAKPTYQTRVWAKDRLHQETIMKRLVKVPYHRLDDELEKNALEELSKLRMEHSVSVSTELATASGADEDEEAKHLEAMKRASRRSSLRLSGYRQHANAGSGDASGDGASCGDESAMSKHSHSLLGDDSSQTSGGSSVEAARGNRENTLAGARGKREGRTDGSRARARAKTKRSTFNMGDAKDREHRAKERSTMLLHTEKHLDLAEADSYSMNMSQELDADGDGGFVFKPGRFPIKPPEKVSDADALDRELPEIRLAVKRDHLQLVDKEKRPCATMSLTIEAATKGDNVEITAEAFVDGADAPLKAQCTARLPTLATIDSDAARNFIKAITTRVAKAAAAEYDGKPSADVNRHGLARALKGYLAFHPSFVLNETEDGV